MNNIFWGDIHNHNEIGYGKGSLDRSFQLAENSLDFYAFTPHGWWTDVPKNDEVIRRHHEAGFAKVRANWEDVCRFTKERNISNQFVTISGWEWHSLEWGDYCLYFQEDNAELSEASTLDELKKFARKKNALILPHHPGYRLGWRGLDWDSVDPELTPVVEMFSEHGNSLEPSSSWGMYNHSMGGIDRSQSGMEQLRKGLKFGFTASGDDHFGYPGAYGQGLTAVIAEKLTRSSIVEALKSRHTYVVTGDRINIDFQVNDGIPGDIVSCVDGVSLSGVITGQDRIRFAELFKNGRNWKHFGPEARVNDNKTDRHLIRIEWGWDLLSSELVTTWDIKVRVENSEIDAMSQSFCGGAGSVTEVNLIQSSDSQRMHVSSYTSRKNTRPVSSITFDWIGSDNSSIIVDVSGLNGNRPFSRSLKLNKNDLKNTDQYLSTSELFSSPKLKIHALIPDGERSMAFHCSDEQAVDGDFYILKVEQENGQMAWCTPVWLTGEKL